MKVGSRLLLAWMIVLMTVMLPGSSLTSLANALFQDDAAHQKAAALLNKLTPEERVGQLFLVTMQGSVIDEKSQIYDLIANHHVGGVVLLRANDNFTGPDNTVAQAYQLTRALQQSEWQASRGTAPSPVNGSAFTPSYVPLLISTSQEGDNFPNDQILNGVSELPDAMAIGATWNPDLSKQVGVVMGRELSEMGFNLYLGPSLDVLDTVPQKISGEDMGVRAFGGDPYWVGEMGQAYISGLHQGSNDRLVVVSKHFPGSGSSDRSPEEEVATVRKSFDQLKQNELLPFFAVTGNAPSPDMVSDGLLVSHIRYQGFQGNIRATTRPISSDAAALERILNQQELFQWRKNGGVLISDNLGSQAIRRFYDPSGRSFDGRTAARDAFLAGNDLLYVDRFISSNEPDAYTTIVHTLDFFAQKYREDDAFAQRVDASAERVLTLKFRLYPQFNLDSVVPPQDGLSDVGSTQNQSVTVDVARRSVSLISPSAAELPGLLPRAPEAGDRILFLTDMRSERQCTGCPDQEVMPVDALQSAVLRLYGPRSGGLVSQQMVSSYAFSDLTKLLNGYPEGEPAPQFSTDLNNADWVVVSMLEPDPSMPDSLAFSRLLSERPDLLRNKKVIVFAFNVPYYLDATDISKLTAYYALYSKTAPFVDVAAKILFQEQPIAPGYSPVSIPGVGYDMIQVTAPDPSQSIPLEIDTPQLAGTPAGTQEPTPAPIFKQNDIIPLRTGVIYDYNHNPVPDGTVVRFTFRTIFSASGESGSSQTPIDTETKDGIARYAYRIERTGILEIQVSTEQGARSNLIRLDTLSGGVTVVAPTPQPTETLMPTPTVTLTVTITPTVVATPTPVPPSVHLSDWFYVMLLVLTSGAGVAYLGIRQAITRWGLRWALCGVIGGMLAYLYMALDMPGSQKLISDSKTAGVLGATLLGVIIGWGIGLLWKRSGLFEGRGPAERTTGERMAGERPATGPKSQSS